VLDALGGVEDGIHQNQEMIGPVVALLVFQEEVHEGLFELKHHALPAVRRRVLIITGSGRNQLGAERTKI
jgi:hypothetical protein